jgi:hypothetical protein
MKSSSFAIPTIVLFAASCIPGTLRACPQQNNADPKACANDCAAPTSGAPGTVAASQTQPPPVTAEKFSFNILAEFSGGLNVKKLKAGDKITAQVAQDVLWKGKIIIPEESRLVGHVTEVKRKTPDDPESRLGVVFDRVLLKHHKELDFQGVIQALSPPAPRKSKVDEPDQMLPPSTMTMNQNPSGPMGGVSTGRNNTSNTTTKSMGIATMPAGVPMYTEANPGSNPGNAVGSARQSGTSSEQKPMSSGMPRGVFGIKGLALTSGPSSSTPGPVIVSNVIDIKLEGGTQVLLKVTDPKVRDQ